MTQIPHETHGFALLAGLSALAEKTRSLTSGLRRRWQARRTMRGLSGSAPLSQDVATNLYIASHLRSKSR